MVIQPDFAQVKVTPVKLVCDTSGSMDSQIDSKDAASERRIDGLNRGLLVGADFMRNHRLLSRSAMVGITRAESGEEWPEVGGRGEALSGAARIMGQPQGL